MSDAGIILTPTVLNMSPLDMMCTIYKMAFGAFLETSSPKQLEVAMQAAAHALPYLHPRLSAATLIHTMEDRKPESLTDAELQKLITSAVSTLADRSVYNSRDAEVIEIDQLDHH